MIFINILFFINFAGFPPNHSPCLRGMIAALRLMTDGMAPNEAIAVSITNKCFDEYEYALVRDVVMTRFAQ